jgi:small subunit ribosomal protein S20
MPNTKQAAKRDRQNMERNARNRTRRVNLRTEIKKFDSLLEANDKPAAEAKLSEVISKLDRTGKMGIIHTKTASRLKSRMTLRFNKTFA